MSNWWFALVVLGFGLFLALYVDRLKGKSRPTAESRSRRKWLTYWFMGRFPTKEEQDLEEKEQEEQQEQEEQERKEQEKRNNPK
ncbi:MAG: hypothetical protein Q8S17_06390 [Humidesulfovibrio sp.]|nr:hypothetical protein [Humidesulfovibrio sp.]